MAYARDTYTGTGQIMTFQINWELGYLDPSHVKATEIAGNEVTELVLTEISPFTFQTIIATTLGSSVNIDAKSSGKV